MSETGTIYGNIVTKDLIRFQFDGPVVGRVVAEAREAIHVYDPRAENYRSFIDRVTRRPE